MIFNSTKYNNCLIISAIPENNNETSGYRAEAPYPKINLREKCELIFNYVPKSIHPDMLGLLCIISFYPFLHKWVTLPEPVSKKFADSVHKLKLFQVIDKKYQKIPGNIHIRNIDSSLETYSGGKNKALSYGGGLDSTATLTLFPEAYVIHEHRINYPDRVKKFLQDIERGWIKWRGKTFCIESNNKDLTKEPGWTGWISCASTSILLATELEIGTILLGSSMGSSYLRNGKGFYPVHQNNPNQWFELLKDLNIDIFSPIAGLTEIALGKIIKQTYPRWLAKDLITYCIKDKGTNCHKCCKCFRRNLVISYILNNPNLFNLDKYQKNTQVIKYLKESPQLGGPSLHWSLIKLGDKLPKWLAKYGYKIKNCKSCLQSEEWIDKHYQQSLELIPKFYRNLCKNRIMKYIPALDKDKEHFLESWNNN